jgi:hypothetical protein
MYEIKKHLVDLSAVDRMPAPVDHRIMPVLTHHGEHCDLGKPVPVRDAVFVGSHIACRPVLFSMMRRGAGPYVDTKGCV